MNLFMDQQFVNVEKYKKMKAPSKNKNTEKYIFHHIREIATVVVDN